MEQIKNITLGPRYDLRLEDLGRWHRFEAVCSACRRRRIIHPDSLRKRWPGYTRVTELERLLHCTGCDNWDNNRLNIGRLMRD